MKTNFQEIALSWTKEGYDSETIETVKKMIKNNPKDVEEAFYRNLEFGTGGLRGIMGVGTNRMNKYTVGMATQGFANYLKSSFLNEKIKVAISYDSRNNSKYFAHITAGVFASNGIEVFLFDDIRPTPVLSFAIRELGCNAGVMITASHNPKEYNGYKAYWSDGAQIIAPHDKNIIAQVGKILNPQQVKFLEGDISPLIHIIGEEIDEKYLSSILSLTLSKEAVKRHPDLKIVYTPLHGTGVKLVPAALKKAGFSNLLHVPEQDVSDGNFPTLIYPNPEEASALEMAIAVAQRENADIVMATDPDADRIGIAVRDDSGKMALLNGNQTASILTYYILNRWQQLGKLDGDQYIVKTVVTTELLKAIASKFALPIYDVLTGFKYIAKVVRENEGKKTFICGGEESYGFNVGEFVRDKDAVVTSVMVAECAAWCADQGLSLYQFLQSIYKELGYYREGLLSLTKKGKDGAEQIAKMMSDLRNNPPKELASYRVVNVVDYLKSEETGVDATNMIKLETEDESVIFVRPSGTEPKIKFYFGVKGSDGDDKIKKLSAIFS
jgi:phosphoglucomutase